MLSRWACERPIKDWLCLLPENPASSEVQQQFWQSKALATGLIAHKAGK
jgi:hypothetical protein